MSTSMQSAAERPRSETPVDRDAKIKLLAETMSAEEKLAYAKQNGWTIRQGGWGSDFHIYRRVDKQDFRGVKSTLKTIRGAVKDFYDEQPGNPEPGEKLLFSIKNSEKDGFDLPARSRDLLQRLKTENDNDHAKLISLLNKVSETLQILRDALNLDVETIKRVESLSEALNDPAQRAGFWGYEIIRYVYAYYVEGKEEDQHKMQELWEEFEKKLEPRKQRLAQIEVALEKIKSEKGLSRARTDLDGPYR